jgi:hypothetical protein
VCCFPEWVDEKVNWSFFGSGYLKTLSLGSQMGRWFRLDQLKTGFYDDKPSDTKKKFL